MPFKTSFKKVEAQARIFRHLLNPKAWSFVAGLKRALPFDETVRSPRVFIDIDNPAIDADAGRYAALLILYFKQAGFQVILAPNFQFLASFRDKRFKKAILTPAPFCIAPQPDALPRVDLWIRDYPSNHAIEAQKTVYLDYAARRPSGEKEIAMPYRIHPDNLTHGSFQKISELRDTPRLWHLFFAGNSDPKKYDKPEVSEGHGVLTRVQVLKTIRTFYGPKNTHLVSPYSNSKSLKRGFCTIDFIKSPVDNRDWLKTLALAQFFVAAPGVHMPMSHNAVESMSVGTIPVLEYGDYFDPPLEHGVNCIAFKGEAGLIESLQHIDRLNEDEIAALRKNVIHYFDTYLSPQSVVQKITAPPHSTCTMLINAHKTRA